MSALTERSQEWLEKALIQGSSEWKEFRRETIGASDAPIILGISPWKTPLELWEEKMGFRSGDEPSWAMLRGIELEDTARQAFEEMTKIYVFPRVIHHSEYQWMIASLDGIDIEAKNIVEIKCPGKKDHAIAKEGKIPEKYYPQLQHQMEVCKLTEAYYFSYDGENGVLLTIKRDQAFIDKMLEKEKEFWNCMKNFIPPK